MKGFLSARLWAGVAVSAALLMLMGAAPPVPAKVPDKKDLAKKEDPALPPALARATPENIEDLKAIQKQTKLVLEKVVPATVGLRIGSAAGSGVIVNEEGYVLTAGHVSGTADRPVEILLHDGRRLKGDRKSVV